MIFPHSRLSLYIQTVALVIWYFKNILGTRLSFTELALVNRQRRLISLFQGSLDVVDCTHQNDPTKFAVPRSATRCVPKREFDRWDQYVIPLE